MVVMITHSPSARWRGPETEELLRNPKYVSSIEERESEVPVTDRGDAELGEERHRGGIKGIAGGNPDMRLDALALKNLHPAPEFRFLFCSRNTSEFGFLFDRNDSPMARHIPVLVSVQGDGPAARLPTSNALPKILDGRFDLENRITVVRHHRKDRFEIPLRHRAFDLRPHHPVHGRTDVIETQEILCAPRVLLHCVLSSV